MQLSKWQHVFFALVLLVFIGQSAIAGVISCPLQAHSQAKVEIPPCHQTHSQVQKAPDITALNHHAAPDCCQQAGHCLLAAAALIGTELTFTPQACSSTANYGYSRTSPLPQDYPLFRPPIAG